MSFVVAVVDASPVHLIILLRVLLQALLIHNALLHRAAEFASVLFYIGQDVRLVLFVLFKLCFASFFLFF